MTEWSLRRIKNAWTAIVMCGLTAAAGAQSTDLERRIADDADISDQLLKHGDSCESAHSIVRVEREQIDRTALAGFCNRAEAGVVAIREYLGDALDQAGGNHGKVVFNVTTRVRQAHASMDIASPHVYLPLRRVQQDTAPYLHEAVHVMALWSRGKALWLSEGFPEHVAAAVAAGTTAHYHHAPVEPRKLASLPEHLASAEGKLFLPLMGEDGLPYRAAPEVREKLALLFTDRKRYAAPYYMMAWSFVDFLVAERGVASLASIGRCDSPHACLNDASGMPSEQLRARWLNSLTQSPVIRTQVEPVPD